jgi:SAM-dependent methyltransferase
MSSAVLQSKMQYVAARAEMRRRGIDCASSRLTRLLHRLKIGNGVAIGDPVKSWDVFETLQFIENNVPRDGAILDIGVFGSEILCILHRLKYTSLTGVDLNPKITRMPHQQAIRYIISDFMQTPLNSASFDAITAISVIEHGFEAKGLLREMSRLLKPGGYFIASVDYWPDKIDTKGMNIFGMDWKIFSKDELSSFIKEAEAYGFQPFGDIHLDAAEPSISWQGKQYTFAWFALKKTK